MNFFLGCLECQYSMYSIQTELRLLIKSSLFQMILVYPALWDHLPPPRQWPQPGRGVVLWEAGESCLQLSLIEHCPLISNRPLEDYFKWTRSGLASAEQRGRVGSGTEKDFQNQILTQIKSVGTLRPAWTVWRILNRFPFRILRDLHNNFTIFDFN